MDTIKKQIADLEMKAVSAGNKFTKIIASMNNDEFWEFMLWAKIWAQETGSNNFIDAMQAFFRDKKENENKNRSKRK